MTEMIHAIRVFHEAKDFAALERIYVQLLANPIEGLGDVANCCVRLAVLETLVLGTREEFSGCLALNLSAMLDAIERKGSGFDKDAEYLSVVAEAANRRAMRH